MPQTCSICLHPDKAQINGQLVAQTPLRKIAVRFATSVSALQRHKGHLPRILAGAQGAHEVVQADDLLAQLKALRSKAVSLLLKAETQGDIRTALMGIREARAYLELLGELEGELNRNPTINVLISPQWIQVRAVIVDALREFPTARALVAERLAEMEGVPA